MVKIAIDTPPELLDLGKRLVFDGTRDEISSRVKELRNLALKYIPVKVGNINYINYEIDGKYQPIANLISILDFNNLNYASKKLGLIYITNYLKREGFLK